MRNNISAKEIGFQNGPKPYWIASTRTTEYPSLDKDITVDTVIVGGGIVGSTCAYLLKQAGQRVAIIEANRLAHGTSGHTTAKITSQHGLIYAKLIKHLGREKAQQYAEANQSAIGFIAKLVLDIGIDCDFSRQPAYIYTQSDGYLKQIESEITAALDLGIEADYIKELPLPLEIKAAERFVNQAQFHPGKYILALAKRIQDDNSYIYENTRAIDFHEGNPCTLITENGKQVKADNMIIASHFPAYGSHGNYFARMYPERSYALGLQIGSSFPRGMYLSAENPSRSLRATPYGDGELVIIAGEKHKTGQNSNTNQYYKNLIDFAQQTYEVIDIPFRWSAQDYTTLDEVPYIGRITAKSPNIYVATGFRKWGMSNGIVSALILTDLITKGENPWAKVYDPARFVVDPMIKNFTTSNITVAKHLIGDKLKTHPKEVELSPGQADIIAHEGTKIGVYRDTHGKLHSVNIVCTHMGCDLAWNEAELSWDCPCHGSRFSYTGDIMEGPALKSLRTDEIRFNP